MKINPEDYEFFPEDTIEIDREYLKDLILEILVEKGIIKPQKDGVDADRWIPFL